MPFAQVYKVDDDFIVLDPDQPIPPAGSTGYGRTSAEALAAHAHYGDAAPVLPSRWASPVMIQQAGLQVWDLETGKPY